MTAAVDKDDTEVSKEGEEKVVSESDEASIKKEDVEDEDDSKKEDAGTADTEEEEKKETVQEEAKPKKTKIVDWPLRDISEPHPNDVLYGRGGGTNHHPGNKRYRKMVEDRKIHYIHSKRLDKPLVALEIIREWRSQDPPGRFLRADDKTGQWNDVGDKKAREKTSQALREKAPTIRKEEEDHNKASGDEDGGDDNEDDESETKVTKSTRFAEGTNTEVKGNGAKKPVLARDHSLGRDYIDGGEDMTLDGFSWQEPFQEGAVRNVSHERMGSHGSMGGGPPERMGSHGSMGGPHERMNSHGSMGGPGGPPPPPPPHDYLHHPQRPSQQQSPYPPPPHGYPPPDRAGSYGSMGSIGVPPPGQGHYRYPSHGSLGPPPPPGGYPPQIPGQDDRHLSYASQGRYESWGSMPGMPPPYGYPPQHVGSWTQPQRDSSGVQREHSLCRNPLPHASVSQPAPYAAFDGRVGSWQWQGPPPPHGHGPPPPHGHGPPPPYPPYPPPPAVSQPYPYGDRISPYGGGPGPDYSGPPPPRVGGPPSPPYEVDPRVAETWSSSGPGEIGKTWSGEEYDRLRSEEKVSVSPRQEQHKGSLDTLPKPDMVKRMTSNQNETAETKRDLVGPSVKRAALNRDNSLASNRLKEKYLPAYHYKQKGPFDSDQEISKLRDNLESSTLASAAKPHALSQEERMSTIDMFAMDLMVKPSPLSGEGRSSTIDALDLDLEDDPILRPAHLNRNSSMELAFADLKGLPRPSALSGGDRLTTTDFLAIVNEPIPDF